MLVFRLFAMLLTVAGVRVATRPRTAADRAKAVDLSWKVHVATTDWIARADSKAWILLGLEGATLAGLITLTAPERSPLSSSGWVQFLFWAGCLLLFSAGLCSLSVVWPQLRRAQASVDARENVVYFGHLRHWDPAQLSVHLLSLDDAAKVDSISRQLVALAQIAWRKHVLLCWSIALWPVGAVAVAASLML